MGSPNLHTAVVPSTATTSHFSLISQAPSRKKRRNVRAQGESYRHVTTINVLPDNVMLEIFDFYRKNNGYFLRTVWNWNWNLLVHVCQRWRQIIFLSPIRLNLQLLCTGKTPVRKYLSIWPAFPIVIDYCSFGRSNIPIGQDNVIAALQHSERVRHLSLDVIGPQLGKVVMAMQKPFPMLTLLNITSRDGSIPAVPAKFLQGSAPRLQEVYLHGIPYPTLPTLLRSASELVSLRLYRIPGTGYISPGEMVGCLGALPRLKDLIIEFQLATPCPNPMLPAPVTRTVLPALTSFQFRGASEYLEDFISRIDGPQLDWIFTDYLNQLVDFQVTQLSRFIDRSIGLKLTPFKHAYVTVFGDKITFTTSPHPNYARWESLSATTVISCEGIDWQVSHMAQVLSNFSITLSNVVHLKLEGGSETLEGTDDVEWLHLLHQFSTVQTLDVSKKLAEHVALTLEDIAEELDADLLPSLELIYLDGHPESSVEKFVAARQLSGRPVTVINTTREFYQRLK